MCVICVDMSGQFQRSSFLPDDIGSDLAVVAGQRSASPGPLGYYDLDDRGGVGPNGKVSLLPGDAGTQITRTNARWSTNLGEAAVVTYAFRSTAPVTMPNGTSGFTQFTATQITATELMLQAWSDVARITFNRVGSGTSGPGAYSDAATMLFGNYSSGASGAAAFAYLAGNTSHAASSGDVWVNSSLSYNAGPQLLRYGYQVLLHEIGHAIGLSHPGDYNAGSGSPSYTDAVYYEDTRQYTVMSYWSESNTGGNFGGNYSSAPLLDDIAAAQRLYGANTTTRTGDTVYGFNSTADRVWFNAGSEISPQAVIFAVWDAGGTDTLDFSGYNQVGIIDLRQGHFSSVGGLVGNVSIAMGAVIEHAIGGLGADSIFGNSSNNRLTGRAGNDNIWGGSGTDTAVFSGNRASYTITYGTETINGQQYRITTVSGPDGTDVLRGVETLEFADQTVTVANTEAAGEVMEGDATNETLTGTAYRDLIYGADGDDTINGGDGDDTISGGRGNDNLTGGNGNDMLSYGGSTGGVTVNMTTGTSSGASGSDTFSGFEVLQGSTFNDTLTGSSAGETIYGWGGVDTINGEGGGDYLIAGDGVLVAASDVIKGSGTANLSIAAAVNVDANFDKMNDPGVVDATSTPHAVVRGSGSGGGQEYFAFTVTAGAACTFDINGASFDSTLRLFDASGNQLAWNDDAASGVIDSLITYTFTTAGTYYIAVGAWASGTGEGSNTSGPVPFNGNYVLNISVPDHSFVPSTPVGSTLNGGAGDDFLQGGSSNDTLDGGDGTDHVVLAGPRSAWTFAGLGGGSYSATNGSQTDILTNVEFVQFTDGTYSISSLTNTATPGNDTLSGTEGDDTISGLAGDDTIYGLGGDDVLRGDAGADTLDGGNGNDTAYYDTSASGVTVNLYGGANAGGDAQGDVLINIEGLWGSDHNDVLSGNSGDNQLFGRHGSDTLYGGGGADYLAGGNGADFLYGEDGVDHLYGNDDNDWLDGGAGNDVMAGGSGSDTYIVDAAGDTIIEFTDDGHDTVLASADWTLSDNLEVLRLNGAAALIGIGNAANNDIFGSDFNNRLEGRAGNDYLYGNAGFDEIFGGDGDDWMSGGADRDGLYAGTGNDTVYGDGGNDVLNGQVGNDLLYGGDGFDEIYGDDGDDYLSGGSDRDGLYGGIGIDSLSGGDGNDVLNGQAGNDTLHGDAGDDEMYGETGSDEIYGGDGDDLMAGGSDRDGLYAGNGNDTVYGDGGNDVLNGQAGNDRLYGGSGFDEIYGDDGDDSMAGGADRDGLYAGIGNDSVWGDAGDDVLNGQAGNDYLNGGDGNDEMYGETGSDEIYGGDGDDLMAGGSDRDGLYAGNGNDTVHGDGGNDVLNGQAGNDRLYGGSGFDEIYGDDGDDAMSGGADRDGLYAGIGNDSVWGDAGDDVLNGQAGNDYLNGGVGNDEMYGETGNDLLEGGAGNDILGGGAGADTLVFGAGFGLDTVYGFEAGAGLGDVIRFSTSLFTSFAEVMAATSNNVDGWAVITSGGNSITLYGVSKAELNANDFEFAAFAPQEAPEATLAKSEVSDQPEVLPSEANDFKWDTSPLVFPDILTNEAPLVLPTQSQAGGGNDWWTPSLDGLYAKTASDGASVTGAEITDTAQVCFTDFDITTLKSDLSEFEQVNGQRRLYQTESTVDWIF